MKRHFIRQVPGISQFRDDLRREVEPCGRCCDRTLEFRIDGLVTAVVELFAFAAEVRRDRDASECFEQLAETLVAVPRKFDDLFLVGLAGFPCRQALRPALRLEIDVQFVVFPFFQVPDNAAPTAGSFDGESPLVIGRIVGLEAENFDACAGRFVENQPCTDHFRVVEYEHRSGGKRFADACEAAFGDAALLVNEQFGHFASLERKFGDAVFWQRIVVVGYEQFVVHGRKDWMRIAVTAP